MPIALQVLLQGRQGACIQYYYSFSCPLLQTQAVFLVIITRHCDIRASPRTPTVRSQNLASFLAPDNSYPCHRQTQQRSGDYPLRNHVTSARSILPTGARRGTGDAARGQHAGWCEAIHGVPRGLQGEPIDKEVSPKFPPRVTRVVERRPRASLCIKRLRRDLTSNYPRQTLSTRRQAQDPSLPNPTLVSSTSTIFGGCTTIPQPCWSQRLTPIDQQPIHSISGG